MPAVVPDLIAEPGAAGRCNVGVVGSVDAVGIVRRRRMPQHMIHRLVHRMQRAEVVMRIGRRQVPAMLVGLVLGRGREIDGENR